MNRDEETHDEGNGWDFGKRFPQKVVLGPGAWECGGDFCVGEPRKARDDSRQQEAQPNPLPCSLGSRRYHGIDACPNDRTHAVEGQPDKAQRLCQSFRFFIHTSHSGAPFGYLATASCLREVVGQRSARHLVPRP